jgi:hypothetical protein
MTRVLAKAVREARRIRRNLLRTRGGCSLSGDCGVASLLLAATFRSPASLRCVHGDGGWHVFNVFEGMIVDITASQFRWDTNEAPVRGILVTETTRHYHRSYGRGNRVLHGDAVIALLTRWNWYVGDTYAERRVARAAALLVDAKRARA